MANKVIGVTKNVYDELNILKKQLKSKTSSPTSFGDTIAFLINSYEDKDGQRIAANESKTLAND